MKNQLVLPFIGVLFIIAISTWASPVDLPTTNQSEKNCKCYNSLCGCCENIEWDIMGINSTVCTEIAYLPKDFGISLTVTWNNYTVINETISARNPPPICFGIPEMEKVNADACLQLYDLTFVKKHFHGCGKLLIRFYHFIHQSVNLGCFSIPEKSATEALANISRVLKTMKDKLNNLIPWKIDSPMAIMI